MSEEAKAAAVDPLDTPELNQAAMDFNRLMPQIAGMSRHINGKGLARVFRAVIEFPFSDKEPKFKTNVERELFLMALHAQTTKQVMLAAVAKNSEELKQLQDKAVDAVVEELQGEVNGKE